jgi:hypothetical protein
MILTERQQTAAALTREIERMGAWVTSPLPLAPGERLRFQVTDETRDQILDRLGSWNWLPRLLSTYPRVTSRGLEPASLYEIFLEPDKQPIADNRIHGELASSDAKSDYEVEMLMKYLGWPKPEKRRR